jgi:hypothetical protein
MESSIRADGPISRSSNQIVTFTDRNLDFLPALVCLLRVLAILVCAARALSTR